MRAALLAGLALGALTPGLALAAPPATLAEALVEAYYNNTQLQEQRASLRQTDEGVPTALAGWRPQVSVTASAGRSSDTLTQQQFNTLTGTSSAVHTPQTANELTAQVTLTQPVYTGGRTLSATRQAKNAVYAARATLLATEQTVFLNVVTAYVTVITDQQVLALNKNNEEVLQEQLRSTTDQFNVGEITLTSVAQAQAALAQGKEQVEVSYGNLENARENFRQLVGEYPAEKLVAPQPLVLPVQTKPEAAKLAISNNPSVVAAQFTDAANKDAVDAAYAQLMPQIAVQLQGYTESGQSGANSSLRGGSALAQLTVPLYQGGSEYAGIRKARAAEQQSFAAILDSQRTAYQQATQAWETFTSTRAAIVSTNAAIKANAVALDGTEREELVGTRTTLDVLNAQQLLLSSQVQQVQNIGTLVTNSYTIASAIGRLTAADLNLPVDHYNDLKYYDAVKNAGFGTGGSAYKDVGVAPNGDLLVSPPLPAYPPPSVIQEESARHAP